MTMSLESIQSAIENRGYFTYFRQGGLYVGKFIKMSEIGNLPMSDQYCYVLLKNGKYIVEHYPKSIPKYEYFESVSQVVDYIKKQFPL